MEPKGLNVCTVLDGYMYFFTVSGSIFARMDLATGRVELLEATFSCVLGKDNALDRMLTVGRNIYAVTLNGRYLVEYRVDTAQTKEIEIGCNYKEWANFAGWFEKEGKIYLYPQGKREEVIYDRMDHTVSRNELSDLSSVQPYRICVVDDCVYLFGQSGDQVIKRRIDTGAEELLTLDRRLEEVRHIVHKNRSLYILTLKREIYVWDHHSNGLKLLCQTETDEALNMAVAEDRIIIPPFRKDAIQIVDLKSGEVSFLNGLPADLKHHPILDWGMYTLYCEDKSRYFFVGGTTNYVLIISKKDGKISWLHPLISDKDIIRYMFKKGYYMTGEEFMELSSFLEEVGNTDLQNKALNTNIGREIFQAIIGEARRNRNENF